MVAPRAEAHANLLRAVPEPNAVLQQPPAQVTLWCSERIALAFSAIQVLDAQGLYTVAWKNVSMVDGHRVRGAFVFIVPTTACFPLFLDALLPNKNSKKFLDYCTYEQYNLPLSMRRGGASIL